jgi:hypothetical protein
MQFCQLQLGVQNEKKEKKEQMHTKENLKLILKNNSNSNNFQEKYWEIFSFPNYVHLKIGFASLHGKVFYLQRLRLTKYVKTIGHLSIFKNCTGR